MHSEDFNRHIYDMFERTPPHAFKLLDQRDKLASERDALAGRVAELEAALSITNEALNKIGDYAHDRSAGPAVWDPLWEIRAMAYDNMCEVDAALSATTPESKP